MKLLNSNELKYRLLRTIIQGIIGVLIANLDLILGLFSIDPATKTFIVALCMAILSPIMAEIGKLPKFSLSDLQNQEQAQG